MQLHAPAVPHGDGIAAPALFAMGSLFWLAEVLARHGPGWDAVGPILIGLAALGNAAANMIRARQSR